MSSPLLSDAPGSGAAAGPAPGLVDLVLPIYNEAHVLERSVDRLVAAMRRLGVDGFRVVIADNGSTDSSREVGERLAAQRPEVCYLGLLQKGRGLALRKTWSETDAELSLYMDVDLSTDLAAVPETIRLLRSGCALVTGSRLDARSKTRRSLKREVLSRGYNLLIALLFRRRGWNDAQCGFKGIRVREIRPLLPLVENNHWFFDTELLLVTQAAGLRIGSLPVTWVEDPDSRVRIASTVWEDLQGLARVRRTLGPKIRAWRRAAAGQEA